MADSFFEFEIDLRNLEENDLVEASADHNDIDLVNNETFGDLEEEWTFDVHDAVLVDDPDEDVPVDIEASISQLVVDDDDLVDPAILDIRIKSKSIPHGEVQDLDALFGPASPPSLLDAEELVSPDHHNIWRPNKDSPVAHPLIANQCGMSQQHFQDPSIVTAGKAISVGFHNASDLKSQFMGAPSATRPGRQFTLHEVERQIRNESPIPCKDNGRISPQTIKTMNRGQPTQYRPPPMPMSGATPYGRNSPAPVTYHLNQAPVGTPARPQMPPAGIQGTPHGTMGQHMSNHMTSGPGVYGMPKASFPMRMGPRHVGQGDGPWTPGLGPGPRIQTPRGQRPMMRAPFTDPGLMRHQAIRDARYQNQFSHQANMMDVDKRHQYNMIQDQRDPRQNTQHYQDRRDHHSYTRIAQTTRDSPRDQSRDYSRWDDEYSSPDSLMTQREKDWIIKIQLLQLQTDNPYADDYYYIQIKMKQLAAERKKQKVGVHSLQKDDDAPRLLLPQLQHTETKSYTPAQFENVLGRLTASSVHNPRPVIDCKINVTHSDEGNFKGTKYKQVLVFVEKLYDVLLDVDDLEKRILASAEDTHPKIESERRHKLDGFYLSLECESSSSLKFNSLMCIRKGKMLINRVLPLLTKEQGYKILDNMLKQLPILIRKDVADEILPTMFTSVSSVIETCDVKDLISLANSLVTAAVPTTQTNPLLTCIQNKFGLSVVCSMLQRCESIFVDHPLDVENSQRDEWSQFVFELADRLVQANERSLPLPKPLASFDNLAIHMERSLDKKTILSIEEIVKTWS